MHRTSKFLISHRHNRQSIKRAQTLTLSLNHTCTLFLFVLFKVANEASAADGSKEEGNYLIDFCGRVIRCVNISESHLLAHNRPIKGRVLSPYSSCQAPRDKRLRFPEIDGDGMERKRGTAADDLNRIEMISFYYSHFLLNCISYSLRFIQFPGGRRSKQKISRRCGVFTCFEVTSSKDNK